MNRQTSIGGRVAATLAALALFIFAGTAALAQSGTSTVRGTVTDAQGGAVAGATVTLTSVEKNFNRTQTTSEGGTYSFTAVPPGVYRVEVESRGFKKSQITDVRAQVDTPAEVSVQLQVGDISEVVTVAGTADVLINTQDATLGNAFTSLQIEQLPLESRNVASLLTLQPGVTREGYVTGARADQSNITLDGIDVNEQQTGSVFTPVLRLTSDSVQEFRVTTQNANANQGRSSGAQVSLLTKSGTNELHGSLYEFHRNTIFTANDFFNNRAGRHVATDPAVVLGLRQVGDERVPRPKLIRNLFGGSIGGPIKKDRAFFFYTYEGRRDAAETPVVRTVPLASLGRGELRFVSVATDAQGNPVAGSERVDTLTLAQLNAIYPSVGINPLAAAALADAARRYPANDFDVTGDSSFTRQLNTAGFRFNANTPSRLNTHIMRLDFNLTEDGRHTLFARGNYQSDQVTQAPQFPDTASPVDWFHPTGVALGHTWTINSRMVNNLRYGLTRQAFSSPGDSTENAISFRFVFSPLAFSRSLSRVTPTHNITDDFSWKKGNHDLQFGTNLRFIRNRRVDFGASYDSAITNPSFYASSGRVLDRPVNSFLAGQGRALAAGQASAVQNAAAAIIGRFSQYTGRFNYDLQGAVQPVGEPLRREFATEEYDLYAQDTWKIGQSLTLTFGLRYGLSMPVYETQGFQVKPNVSLGEFFERRVASAEAGRPLNELIQFELAGPAHDKPGFYSLDKNNFQPRVAVAWSPDFKSGWKRALFGGDNKSVIRGGFAITNDYFGQQLAVSFDQLSTLGFSTSNTIAANTYNVTSRPAPRFTGFGQSVRTLPGLVAPNRFQTPADEAERIESSLDDTLVSPINYSWNVSYGRELPGGTFVEASYVGRKARNLLATRDIMHFNNLRDPRSGQSWYEAANILHTLREQNADVGAIPNLPFFTNLFPNLGPNLADQGWGDFFADFTPTQAVFFLAARDGYDILDWTYIQSNDLLDNNGLFPNMFVHPQYAAFSVFSTVARSDYHGGTLSIRQRYKDSLAFDFNYTLSKSMDNASGLQTSGTYGAAFIINPLDPDQNYAVSDFDVRHSINANAIWQLPLGRGRRFLGGMNSVANAVLGGWQLTGIMRWNSGLPAPTPFDQAQWATNWNVQSNGVRIRPIQSSPNRGSGDDAPNLFADPLEAFRSFRNARPGEVGDRNVLRLPGFFVVDAGLSKSFGMPWSEGHKLQFRWEVFNVTNTQRLDIQTVTRQNFGLPQDPQSTEPASTFGNFDSIQGSPRVMQFGLRYTF